MSKVGGEGRKKQINEWILISLYFDPSWISKKNSLFIELIFEQNVHQTFPDSCVFWKFWNLNKLEGLKKKKKNWKITKPLKISHSYNNIKIQHDTSLFPIHFLDALRMWMRAKKKHFIQFLEFCIRFLRENSCATVSACCTATLLDDTIDCSWERL